MLDLGLLGPGQANQHVDVVAHHGGFGRHGRHELQFFKLGIGLLARLFRHAGKLDFFLDLLDVGAVFAFAQLFLDRLDLLVQVEVALVLLHLALDAATDFLVDVEDVDLALDLLKQIFQPLFHARQIQHRLLAFELERQVRGDGVCQAAGLIDAGDRGQDLGRDLLVQLDVLVKLLHHGAAQRLDLGIVLVALDHFERRHGGNKVRIFTTVLDVRDGGALLAFDQHLHGAVGQLEHLQDGRHTADLEHVVDRRLVLGGGLLRHQHDAAVGGHGGFERLDALGAAHEQRDDHVGEHHHVAQRQQRQVDGGGGQGDVSGHDESSG